MKYINTILAKLTGQLQNLKLRYFIEIVFLIVTIFIFHYIIFWHYHDFHFVFSQCYFIPIIMAAKCYGIKGGFSSAFFISMIYTLFIIPASNKFIPYELIHLCQIFLYYLVGYFSALKTQYELKAMKCHKKTRTELSDNLKKIKEQSAKLNELEEQLRLSDRLAVMGELTVGLAHELRNPLSTIISTINMIEDDRSMEAKGNKYFRILNDETNRLKQFVENYLDFTHKRIRKKTLYDVNELIRNAIIMFSGEVFKNRSKIKMVLPEHPLQLLGDSNHLWQIIMNLLLNALQSMTNGGEVSITANKIIAAQVNFSKNGNDPNLELLQLIIADQGIGIPEENLNKIFQPFYTTKSSGTGLGLSIVKSIVDENEWQIEVKSEQNKGTEFKLYIPLLY